MTSASIEVEKLKDTSIDFYCEGLNATDRFCLAMPTELREGGEEGRVYGIQHDRIVKKNRVSSKTVVRLTN